MDSLTRPVKMALFHICSLQKVGRLIAPYGRTLILIASASSRAYQTLHAARRFDEPVPVAYGPINLNMCSNWVKTQQIQAQRILWIRVALQSIGS